MATATDHRRFPFLAAAAEAFQFLHANFSTFIAVAWVWVVLGCTALVAWMYGLIWLIRSSQDLALGLGALSPRFLELLLSIPPLLVELLGMAAVAVTWHRFFILNERPQGLIPFHPARVAHYIARTILLFAIVFLTVLLVSFVMMGIARAAALSPALSVAVALVPLVVMFFGLFVMLRAGLALPAAAIGDRKWTLERSWHETNGNGLRLFAGMFIVALPFYIGNAAIALWAAGFGGTENPPMFVFTGAVSNAFAAMGAAATAGFYSRAFVFFSPPDAAKDRPPASVFA